MEALLNDLINKYAITKKDFVSLCLALDISYEPYCSYFDIYENLGKEIIGKCQEKYPLVDFHYLEDENTHIIYLSDEELYYSGEWMEFETEIYIGWYNSIPNKSNELIFKLKNQNK